MVTFSLPFTYSFIFIHTHTHTHTHIHAQTLISVIHSPIHSQILIASSLTLKSDAKKRNRQKFKFADSFLLNATLRSANWSSIKKLPMLTQEMRSQIINPLIPLGSTKSKSEYVVLMPNVHNWSYLNKACKIQYYRIMLTTSDGRHSEVGGAVYLLNPQN